MEEEITWDVKEVEGVLIVAPTGELDFGNHPTGYDPLRDIIMGYLNDDNKNPVVEVDMRQVDYIDTTTIGGLVGCQKKARKRGGEIRLVVTSPKIMRVLEIIGLNKNFTISTGEEGAMEGKKNDAN